jgi:hypothetical protein
LPDLQNTGGQEMGEKSFSSKKISLLNSKISCTVWNFFKIFPLFHSHYSRAALNKNSRVSFKNQVQGT